MARKGEEKNMMELGATQLGATPTVATTKDATTEDPPTGDSSSSLVITTEGTVGSMSATSSRSSLRGFGPTIQICLRSRLVVVALSLNVLTAVISTLGTGYFANASLADATIMNKSGKLRLQTKSAVKSMLAISELYSRISLATAPNFFTTPLLDKSLSQKGLDFEDVLLFLETYSSTAKYQHERDHYVELFQINAQNNAPPNGGEMNSNNSTSTDYYISDGDEIMKNKLKSSEMALRKSISSLSRELVPNIDRSVQDLCDYSESSCGRLEIWRKEQLLPLNRVMETIAKSIDDPKVSPIGSPSAITSTCPDNMLDQASLESSEYFLSLYSAQSSTSSTSTSQSSSSASSTFLVDSCLYLYLYGRSRLLSLYGKTAVVEINLFVNDRELEARDRQEWLLWLIILRAVSTIIGTSVAFVAFRNAFDKTALALERLAEAKITNQKIEESRAQLQNEAWDSVQELMSIQISTIHEKETKKRKKKHVPFDSMFVSSSEEVGDEREETRAERKATGIRTGGIVTANGSKNSNSANNPGEEDLWLPSEWSDSERRKEEDLWLPWEEDLWLPWEEDLNY